MKKKFEVDIWFLYVYSMYIKQCWGRSGGMGRGDDFWFFREYVDI